VQQYIENRKHRAMWTTPSIDLLSMACVGRREGRKSRRSPNCRCDDSVIMDGKRTLLGCGLNVAG
jgi:hypothetical protein